MIVCDVLKHSFLAGKRVQFVLVAKTFALKSK